MTIRSFIALPIPKDAANQLGDLSARMAYQDKSNAVRWVDQENYHITLAFLGDQNIDDLETLAESLDETINQASTEAFITRLSPFPESKPKLIAAMIDRNEVLLTLNRQVISATNAAGLRLDKRRFIPHVTLGRYRHTKNVFAGAIPMNLALNMVLDELVLYESVLATNGAEYEAIYRFPLDEVSFDEI